jgi:cytochrome c oxidase subunit 1
MIMVGGMVMAYLGGVHFWWPKITGKLYPEKPAQLSAIALFIGFILTFLPQFFLGYLGIPRRYPIYPESVNFLHILSTCGVPFLAVGYLSPLFYLSWSLFKGKAAPENPWNAKGLEWQTSSPPPEKNFLEAPVVPAKAYDYPIQEEA